MKKHSAPKRNVSSKQTGGESQEKGEKPCHIMAQLAIVFGFSMAGEFLGDLLSFPSSVTAMLLLALALLLGFLKEAYIEDVANFLVKNMGFFFVAVCVGLMEHFSLILSQFVPFLLIACGTTPFVYALTAWSIQLYLKKKVKKQEEKRGN